MKLTLRDRWDDLTTNDRYVEIKIGKAQACCVKETEHYSYVMECFDGNNVYSDIGGADYPLRKLTPEEVKEILDFASEQFEVENMLDEKLNGGGGR